MQNHHLELFLCGMMTAKAHWLSEGSNVPAYSMSSNSFSAAAWPGEDGVVLLLLIMISHHFLGAKKKRMHEFVVDSTFGVIGADLGYFDNSEEACALPLVWIR